MSARNSEFDDIGRRYGLGYIIIGGLALLAVFNWLIFAAISVNIGGVAIGTLPSKEGFVVTDHGHQTAVSELTWLFSLYYPLATLTLTPALWLLFASMNFDLVKGRVRRYFIVGVVFVWAMLWYSAIIRDASRSIVDYINL